MISEYRHRESKHTVRADKLVHGYRVYDYYLYQGVGGSLTSIVLTTKDFHMLFEPVVEPTNKCVVCGIGSLYCTVGSTCNDPLCNGCYNMYRRLIREKDFDNTHADVMNMLRGLVTRARENTP